MKNRHSEAGMGAADAVLALAIGLAVMGVGAAIVHDRQEAARARTAGAWINDLGYAAQAYAKQHFDDVYQAAGNNGLVIRTSQLDRDPDGNGPLPALGAYLRNAPADDALGNQARIILRRGANAYQIQVVVLSDLDQQALPAGKLGAVLEAPGQYGFGVQKSGTAYLVASPGGASSGNLDSLITAQQRNGVQLAAITTATRGYGYGATVLKGPAPAVAIAPPPVVPPPPPPRVVTARGGGASFGTFSVQKQRVMGGIVIVSTYVLDQGGGNYLVMEGGDRGTTRWVPSKIVLLPNNRAEVWK